VTVADGAKIRRQPATAEIREEYQRLESDVIGRPLIGCTGRALLS
jgi:hypothetical protein